MKYLIIIFIASCVVKVTTFAIREVVKYQGKEYEKFYEAEAYRKYLEHDYDYMMLSALVQQSRELPKNLRPVDRAPDPENRYKLVFERTWFQDYVCFLNQHIPAANLSDGNDLAHYPDKLLNTVREEYSRNQIYSYCKSKDWLNFKVPDYKVKGIITEMHEVNDEISIKILPYGYSTSLQPYENFEKDNTTFLINSNPFYYKGSLKGISCTLMNPVTCENRQVRFD